MALDGWTDEGMDWGNPNPLLALYVEAIREAIIERSVFVGVSCDDIQIPLWDNGSLYYCCTEATILTYINKVKALIPLYLNHMVTDIGEGVIEYWTIRDITDAAYKNDTSQAPFYGFSHSLIEDDLRHLIWIHEVINLLRCRLISNNDNGAGGDIFSFKVLESFRSVGDYTSSFLKAFVANFTPGWIHYDGEPESWNEVNKKALAEWRVSDIEEESSEDLDFYCTVCDQVRDYTTSYEAPPPGITWWHKEWWDRIASVSSRYGKVLMSLASPSLFPDGSDITLYKKDGDGYGVWKVLKKEDFPFEIEIQNNNPPAWPAITNAWTNETICVTSDYSIDFGDDSGSGEYGNIVFQICGDFKFKNW